MDVVKLLLAPVGKSSLAEVNAKTLRSADTGCQFKPTKSLLQTEGHKEIFGETVVI